MVDALGEVDQFGGLERSFATFAERNAAIEKRNLYVFEHGELRDQVEALKDEADPPAADIGELVILEAVSIHAGKSSVTVGVEVYAEDLNSGRRRQTNSCRVTFVAVDPKGKPAPVPPLSPETQEEKRLFAEAEARYKDRKKSG
jgi:hypothetical protein